jgi:hypothetical protein
MATLDDKPFDEAVTVHGARPGLVQNISSVRQAAEWLLHKWPDRTDTDKAWRAQSLP